MASVGARFWEERASTLGRIRGRARVGVTVAPTLKWMLAAVRVAMRDPKADVADAAVQRLVAAYPEDLEGYGMLSELALRRQDKPAARKALNDAMRMLDRLELHDVYERERKKQFIVDALASIAR